MNNTVMLCSLAIIATVFCSTSAFSFQFANPFVGDDTRAFVSRASGITSAASTAATQLQMGLLENLGLFLNKREGDFVKLESSLDTFGPGPVILLYGCPSGVTDDELKDMIKDGAPEASKASSVGVICRRIDSGDDSLLDMSVGEALENIVQGKTAADAANTSEEPQIQPPCPVIYFSGISNEEMMATYRIISSEIYEETGGTANAACAKAVPPAMEKSLRQVIEEITGDHLDAITPDDELRDYGP
mmetsp:Transcript_29780/g.65993  ORF Transcript_29780/g.65993 Transcript_29780/m.65993 type:complete len:246 (-) Transcript_29780:82-819(-)